MKWVNGGLGLAFVGIVLWTIAQALRDAIWLNGEQQSTGLWLLIAIAGTAGAFWLWLRHKFKQADEVAQHMHRKTRVDRENAP